ncbi:MAG TPA: ParA family protein [Candidatus Altiarchaeales archaeon]|nr:ParA family protein [Candidatus Altiarchaeales archaeon]
MTAMVIAFTHHKGGTGKTTSCVNIAGELARRDKKVLVVDIDPQGSATAGLGINKNSIKKSMYDVLLAICEDSKSPRMKDVIVKTKIDNIDIAPANIDLAGISVIMQRNDKPAEILNRIIRDMRDKYDYILIDTPPGYSLLSINGIVASDHIVLPLDSGVFSMDSIETFSILLNDIHDELKVKKKVGTVIITEFDEMSIESILSRIIRNINSIFSISDRRVQNSVHADEVIERLSIFLSVNDTFDGNVFVVPYSKTIRDSQLRGLQRHQWFPQT